MKPSRFYRHDDHRACRPLQNAGEDVAIKEVTGRKVTMGTQYNVVGTIFLCLFKNVIHDQADNSHRVNFDSGGPKRIRKSRQSSLQFGDAFRSLQRPSGESGSVSQGGVGPGFVNVEQENSCWEFSSKLTSFFDHEI